MVLVGTKLEEGIEWKAEKREREGRRTKVVEAESENEMSTYDSTECVWGVNDQEDIALNRRYKKTR